MKVKFNYFYDKDTKETLGVELPDKTILMIDKKERGFRIAFPKKKFWKMFKMQQKQKGKYLEVMFSEKELKIIEKVFSPESKKEMPKEDK